MQPFGLDKSRTTMQVSIGDRPAAGGLRATYSPVKGYVVDLAMLRYVKDCLMTI